MSVLLPLVATGKRAVIAPAATATAGAAGIETAEVLHGQKGDCAHCTVSSGDDGGPKNVAAEVLSRQKGSCGHFATHEDDCERDVVSQQREAGNRLDSPEHSSSRTATAETQCNGVLRVLKSFTPEVTGVVTLPAAFTRRASAVCTAATASATAAAVTRRATWARQANKCAPVVEETPVYTARDGTAAPARAAAEAPIARTLGEREQVVAAQCDQQETTESAGGVLPPEATDMNFSCCRVAVKIRPLTKEERAANQDGCLAWGGCRLHVLPPVNRTYTVDYLFPPESTRAELFNTCVVPLLRAFISGYNATILAYGQTGTGKTYMMGSYCSASLRRSHTVDPATRLRPSAATAALRPSGAAAEETKGQVHQAVKDNDVHGILQLASFFLFRALEERRKESHKRAAAAAPADAQQTVEGIKAATAKSAVHGMHTAEVASAERNGAAGESTTATEVQEKGAAAPWETAASEGGQFIAGGTGEKRTCSPTPQESQQLLMKTEVSCSYMELYNEEIRDLLDAGGHIGGRDVVAVPGAAAAARTATGGGPAGERKKRYTLQENPVTKQVCVRGLTQHVVTSPEELLSCVERGSLARATAATKMNNRSSRSHAVFTITLQQRWSHLSREEGNGQQQQEDENIVENSYSRASRSAAVPPRAGEVAKDSRDFRKREETGTARRQAATLAHGLPAEGPSPAVAVAAASERRGAAASTTLQQQVVATDEGGAEVQLTAVPAGEGTAGNAEAGKAGTATSEAKGGLRKRAPTAATGRTENAITSKIHFVDLAGSERVKRAQVDGQRLREGIAVNVGLLALSNVICALAAKKETVHRAGTSSPEAAVQSGRTDQMTFYSPSRCSRAATYAASGDGRTRVAVAGEETAGESVNAEAAAEVSQARGRRHYGVRSEGAETAEDSDGEASLKIPCSSGSHADWEGPCPKAGSREYKKGMVRVLPSDGANAVLRLAYRSLSDSSALADTFLSLHAARSAATGERGRERVSRKEVSRSLQAPLALEKSSSSPFPLARGAGGRGGPQRQHVPYRASKLTRILQDSLGGDRKTLMLVCVSPAAADCRETYRSMHYASRTMCIRNSPVVQQDPTAMLIQNLRRQVLLLQRQAATASEGAAAGDAVGWRRRCVRAEAAAAAAAEEVRLLRLRLQASQAQLKRLRKLEANREREGIVVSDMCQDEEEDGDEDEGELSEEMDGNPQPLWPQQSVAVEAPPARNESQCKQEQQQEGEVEEQAEEHAERGGEGNQQQPKHHGQRRNEKNRQEGLHQDETKHRELNPHVRVSPKWQQKEEQRRQQEQQQGMQQGWSLRHGQNCQEHRQQMVQEHRQKHWQLGQLQHDLQQQHILLQEADQQQPVEHQQQGQKPQQDQRKHHGENVLKNSKAKVGHQLQGEGDAKPREGQQKQKTRHRQPEQLQERYLVRVRQRPYEAHGGSRQQHQQQTEEQGGRQQEQHHQQSLQHSQEAPHDTYWERKKQHQPQRRQQPTGQQQQQQRREQHGQLQHGWKTQEEVKRKGEGQPGQEYDLQGNLQHGTQKHHESQGKVEDQQRQQTKKQGRWWRQGDHNERVKVHHFEENDQELLRGKEAHHTLQEKWKQREQEQQGEQREGQGVEQDKQLEQKRHQMWEARRQEEEEHFPKDRLQESQEGQHWLQQKMQGHQQQGQCLQHGQRPPKEQQPQHEQREQKEQHEQQQREPQRERQQQREQQQQQREQQQQQREQQQPQQEQQQYEHPPQREQQQHEQRPQRMQRQHVQHWQREQQQHVSHPQQQQGQQQQEQHPQQQQQQYNRHLQRWEHLHEQHHELDRQAPELHRQEMQHSLQEQLRQGSPHKGGPHHTRALQQHQQHLRGTAEKKMHGDHQVPLEQSCENDYRREKEQRSRQGRQQQQELQHKEAAGKPRRQHLLQRAKLRCADTKQKRQARRVQEKHKQPRKQQWGLPLQPAQRQQRQQRHLQHQRPQHRQTQQQRPSPNLADSEKSAEQQKQQRRRPQLRRTSLVAEFFAEDFDSSSSPRLQKQGEPQQRERAVLWENQEDEELGPKWKLMEPQLWTVPENNGRLIEAVMLQIEEDVERQQKPSVAPAEEEDDIPAPTLEVAKPESIVVPTPIVARSPPLSVVASRASRSSISGSSLRQHRNSVASSFSIRGPSSISVSTWSSKSTADTASVAGSNSSESNGNAICPPLTNLLLSCTQVGACGVVSSTDSESEPSPWTGNRRTPPHSSDSSHGSSDMSSKRRHHSHKRRESTTDHSDWRSSTMSPAHHIHIHTSPPHHIHIHSSQNHYGRGRYTDAHDGHLYSGSHCIIRSNPKSVADSDSRRGSTGFTTAFRKHPACTNVSNIQPNLMTQGVAAACADVTSTQPKLLTVGAAAAGMTSPRKYLRASSSSTISSVTSGHSRCVHRCNSKQCGASGACSDGGSFSSLPVWHEKDECGDGCLHVDCGVDYHSRNNEGDSSTVPMCCPDGDGRKTTLPGYPTGLKSTRT